MFFLVFSRWFCKQVISSPSPYLLMKSFIPLKGHRVLNYTKQTNINKNFNGTAWRKGTQYLTFNRVRLQTTGIRYCPATQKRSGKSRKIAHWNGTALLKANDPHTGRGIYERRFHSFSLLVRCEKMMVHFLQWLSICRTYSQNLKSKHGDHSRNAPNDHSDVRVDLHVRASAHGDSSRQGCVLNVHLSRAQKQREVRWTGRVQKDWRSSGFMDPRAHSSFERTTNSFQKGCPL